MIGINLLIQPKKTSRSGCDAPAQGSTLPKLEKQSSSSRNEGQTISPEGSSEESAKTDEKSPRKKQRQSRILIERQHTEERKKAPRESHIMDRIKQDGSSAHKDDLDKALEDR